MATDAERNNILEQLADLLVEKPQLMDNLRKLAESDIDLIEALDGHGTWLNHHEGWIHNMDPERFFEPTDEHPKGLANSTHPAPRGQRVSEVGKLLLKKLTQ